MRVRLEFARGEKMKYLSHLDLMRTFCRAMRRGGIPVLYSAGFNPHAQMVFGLPLPVGVTGDAEYLDIDLDIDLDKNHDMDMEDGFRADDIKAKLNAVLPDGLTVTAARIKTTKQNIMSAITHASYEMRVGIKSSECSEIRDVRQDLENAVASFRQPGLRVVAKDSGGRANGKKNRRGGENAAKLIDLAPLVRSLEVREDTIVMTVSAGSVNNVKPDMILAALNEILRAEVNVDGRSGGNSTYENGGNSAYENGGNSAYENGGNSVCADGCFRELVKISLHRESLYIERGGVLYKPIDSIICDAGNIV